MSKVCSTDTTSQKEKEDRKMFKTIKRKLQGLKFRYVCHTMPLQRREEILDYIFNPQTVNFNLSKEEKETLSNIISNMSENEMADLDFSRFSEQSKGELQFFFSNLSGDQGLSNTDSAYEYLTNFEDGAFHKRWENLNQTPRQK